jgi:hypothetical protein
MEAFGSVRLVESIPAHRAIAASVPRQEVADTLEDDGTSWDLLLQVARRDDRAKEERSTISMTWSREDLEGLLDRATGDRVALTFDRDQLAEAMTDVEAHGLREHALVFAVAATGVLGAGTAIANAMPATDIGEPIAQSSPAAPAAPVTDVSSTGGYGYVAAASEGGSAMTDVSSGGGYADTAVASEGGSTVTDASTGGYTMPAATDSGSSGFLDGIPTPSPTETGLIGGIALAIAGAAFVGRRSRPTRSA